MPRPMGGYRQAVTIMAIASIPLTATLGTSSLPHSVGLHSTSFHGTRLQRTGVSRIKMIKPNDLVPVRNDKSSACSFRFIPFHYVLLHSASLKSLRCPCCARLRVESGFRAVMIIVSNPLAQSLTIIHASPS